MIFFFSSALVDLLGRAAVGRSHELVEERPAEARRQFPGQIMRLGQVLLGQLAQPLLAVDAS